MLQVLGQQKDLSNVTGKQEGKNFINAFSARGSSSWFMKLSGAWGSPGARVSLGWHQRRLLGRWAGKEVLRGYQ